MTNLTPAIYGAAPKDLGEMKLDTSEMMFWIYLPIKMPGTYSEQLPNLGRYSDGHAHCYGCGYRAGVGCNLRKPIGRFGIQRYQGSQRLRSASARQAVLAGRCQKPCPHPSVPEPQWNFAAPLNDDQSAPGVVTEEITAPDQTFRPSSHNSGVSFYYF